MVSITYENGDDVVTPIAASAVAPKTSKPSSPLWESKAKESLKNFLKKNTKSLTSLLERDAVEGDTRTFVTDMLVEGFGYDKYEELTAEYLVKGEFADIGIRIDKQIHAFVEIKRVSVALKDQHLRQVKTYAANEGVDWAILTNGRIWEVFHISNTTPLTHTLVFSVDLLSDQTPSQKVDKLWRLSREAMKRDILIDEWKAVSALSLDVISQAVTSDEVIKALKSQIKKQTKQIVDESKLKSILKSKLQN